MPKGKIKNIMPEQEGKDRLIWIQPISGEDDVACFYKGDATVFQKEHEVTYKETGRSMKNGKKIVDISQSGNQPEPQENQWCNETPNRQAPASTFNGMLPKDTNAAAAAYITSPKKHPGLWLDRFPEDVHLQDQKNQKSHLDRVVQARPWGKESYKTILEHLEGGLPSIRLSNKSRIALHLSRAGGLENANCCLHPVYGFAYLPGSGLKGVAHAYACHLFACKNTASEDANTNTQQGGELGAWVSAEEKENFICCVEDIFGWAPNDLRSKTDDKKAQHWQPRSARKDARTREDRNKNKIPHQQQRGAIIFHDAFGMNNQHEPPHLEIDVLTNHYPDYYGEGKAPGDWQSPIPVSFLTIAANTEFHFRVTCSSTNDSTQNLLSVAKRFLLGGLHWLGAGAKTAAGYGAFTDTWILSAEDIRKEKMKKQRAIADKDSGALIKIYSELSSGQILWVSQNKKSKSGYRLILDANHHWTREDEWEFSKKEKPNLPGDAIIIATKDGTTDKKLIKDFDATKTQGLVPPV